MNVTLKLESVGVAWATRTCKARALLYSLAQSAIPDITTISNFTWGDANRAYQDHMRLTSRPMCVTSALLVLMGSEEMRHPRLHVSCVSQANIHRLLACPSASNAPLEASVLLMAHLNTHLAPLVDITALQVKPSAWHALPGSTGHTTDQLYVWIVHKGST